MQAELASRILFCIIVLNMLFAPVAGARQPNENNTQTAHSPWSVTLRGGHTHQFAAYHGQAGSFAASRLFIQAGAVYQPDYKRSISLSLGYGHNAYNFSDYKNSQKAPWQNIHSLRLSTPLRWVKGREWTIIVVPTVRFKAESTSDWDNAVTGGGVAGFAYQFNDRLAIGPGIGMLSQLEDSATVFPILIIMWKITERLSLSTGKGPATAEGPGLIVNWKLTDQWGIYLGGRYEKERFRLTSEGPVPRGIGEDTSFPLFVGVNYFFTKTIRVNIVGGVKIGGELRQEDRQGQLVDEKDYGSTPFLGVSFTGRF